MTRADRIAAWTALTFVVFVQAAWWLTLDGVSFADGDSYLRLLRVERLFETGAWFDVTIPGANAPFGFELHWTRPLDILMLLVAVPLIPFMSAHDAIYIAGVWISPVLHLALAGSMIWALRPVLGGIGSAVAAGLTATQIAWLSFAIVGRADHHMLFALAAVIALGFVLRAQVHGERRLGTGLGFSLAGGLWVGPEFLVFIAFVLGWTGLLWLKGRDGATRLNGRASAALAIGTGIALLIERGGAIAVVEYDRLSAFHFVMVFVIFGFWAVLDAAERRIRTSTSMRLLWAGAGVAVLAAVSVRFFPGVLDYPFPGVDPAFLRIQAMISDYQGIATPDRFLIYLGAAVPAAPWLAYRLLRGPQRIAWMVIALGFVVYLGFAMNWTRWILYAAVFMTVPLADLIVTADGWAHRRFGSPLRVFVKLAIVAGLIFGPAALGFSLRGDVEPDGKAAEECPVDRLSAWIRAEPRVDPDTVIVAAPNFGPEILYRTGRGVVATLSHRNDSGVLDVYRLMTGTSDAALKDMAAKRNLGVIVICPDSGAESFIRRDAVEHSLQNRLLSGNLPEGVSEAALPLPIADAFRVFLIDRGGQDG